MRYVCLACGYIYDPKRGDLDNCVPPGTPGSELPTDWVCPGCKASQDDFASLEEEDD